MPDKPEKALWASVLRQAMDDLSHKNDLIRDKAIAWFEERKRKFSTQLCDIEGCDPEIGSFKWVCSIFGLHAKVVRTILLDRHKEEPDQLFNEILSLKPKECRG